MLGRFLLIALAVSALGGCSSDPPPPSFAACPDGITGTEEGAAEAIAVDIYLDATTSMEGYVGRQTEYGTFLYDLESALSSRWREADVQFYRFGTRVDSVGREAYLRAREELGFYRQRGLFERTNIDSVLVRAHDDRVSVIVTDLFQDDGDTNELVEQIKDRVFSRGLALGVLGIGSRFDGTVYDAPGGPYRYASTPGDPATFRPFYALIIGQPAYLRRLFRTVEGSPTVQQDRFVLISPTVVSDYELSLEKPRESEGINVQSARDNRFNIRDGFEEGTLRGTLTFEPAPSAAPFDPASMELVAYGRAPGQQDSVRTDDLEIDDLEAEGDAVTFDLEIEPSAGEGTYQYLLLFQVGDLGGLGAPVWVRDLSTTNPTVAADPNKTLNLERLVSNLIDASSTVRRPLVGCTAITVNRQ